MSVGRVSTPSEFLARLTLNCNSLLDSRDSPRQLVQTFQQQSGIWSDCSDLLTPQLPSQPPPDRCWVLLQLLGPRLGLPSFSTASASPTHLQGSTSEGAGWVCQTAKHAQTPCRNQLFFDCLQAPIATASMLLAFPSESTSPDSHQLVGGHHVGLDPAGATPCASGTTAQQTWPSASTAEFRRSRQISYDRLHCQQPIPQLQRSLIGIPLRQDRKVRDTGPHDFHTPHHSRLLTCLRDLFVKIPHSLHHDHHELKRLLSEAWTSPPADAFFPFSASACPRRWSLCGGLAASLGVLNSAASGRNGGLTASFSPPSSTSLFLNQSESSPSSAPGFGRKHSVPQGWKNEAHHLFLLFLRPAGLDLKRWFSSTNSWICFLNSSLSLAAWTLINSISLSIWPCITLGASCSRNAGRWMGGLKAEWGNTIHPWGLTLKQCKVSQLFIWKQGTLHRPSKLRSAHNPLRSSSRRFHCLRNARALQHAISFLSERLLLIDVRGRATIAKSRRIRWRIRGRHELLGGRNFD